MKDIYLRSLLARCRSANPAEQHAALRALRARKEEAALPDVIALLSSPDAGVRSQAAWALEVLGARAADIAGPALARALADPEGLVRSAAADARGVIGYVAGAPQVRALLRDPDPVVRAAAAETLGDLRQAHVAKVQALLSGPAE